MSEKKSSIIKVTARCGCHFFEVDTSKEACNKFMLGTKEGGKTKACSGDRFMDTEWVKGSKGSIIGEVVNNPGHNGDLAVILDKDDGGASLYSKRNSELFSKLVKI